MTLIHHWLAIAAGGALGAMARFWLVQHIATPNKIGFSWGIFLVNLCGSFFMGLAVAYFMKTSLFTNPWQSFVMIGLLGAFTTFSTFAYESLVLIQQQLYGLAFIYIMVSVVFCIAAVAAGFALGRWVF